MAWVLLAVALILAFLNGANDNMKGVATLYGAGVFSRRKALLLATVSTGLGSLASIYLAPGLLRAFSAKGLVPQESLTPAFLAAAALAAGGAVLLATRFGFPVSTTHALLGGLAGAGFVAAGPALNLGALGATFVLPLLLSPLLAIVLAGGMYVAGRWTRRRLGIEAATCVCVGKTWVPMSVAPRGVPSSATFARIGATSGAVAAPGGTRLAVFVDESAEACWRRYVGAVAGVSAHRLVTAAHVTSAGVVGFARALNDTPKILGLLAGVSFISPAAGGIALGAAMAAGGLLASRRVAETLGKNVTAMNEGQGFAGNLATSILVAGASGLGLPVSTTHVAAGGLFGIGSVTGDLRWKTAGSILAAWITTLPLAAALGATGMWVLRR